MKPYPRHFVCEAWGLTAHITFRSRVDYTCMSGLGREYRGPGPAWTIEDAEQNVRNGYWREIPAPGGEGKESHG